MGIILEGQCSCCRAILEPVFAYAPGQYQDALDLTLNPGYGEYIDGFCLVKFYMCNECSDKLFKLFPTLKDEIIKEAERIEY